MTSPAWLAVTLQVPLLTTVKVADVVLVAKVGDDTVQMLVSLLVNVFCREAELVEEMVNAATPYTRSAKVPNVMVCAPLFMVSTASAEVTVETAPALPKLLTTTEYVPASATVNELSV